MQKVHLAPNGSDRWSGRLPSPSEDGRDGPLASLSAVLRSAREIRRETGEPAHVLVAPGNYSLTAPLTFLPEDSGQVWSAAPGARPVFSGGEVLSGWTVGEHAEREAWFLDLPEVKDGSWNFTQLWVNGQRRERPSLPKKGWHTFAGFDGQPNSGFACYKGPTRAEYRPGEVWSFHNLEDVVLVAYQLWFDTHHRIKAVDEAQHLVHFRQPSLGSLRDESAKPARYRLVNVFDALTEPGEWYLDRVAGRLIYLPLPGEAPANTHVVAPRLAECVRFQSTAGDVVAGIRLENLVFAHTEWSRDVDNVGTIQAAYDVPGSVIFDRAENCVLYGCEIAHCAGYGVEILTGCHGNIIASCTIRDLGAGGVKIGHESLEVHDPALGKAFDFGDDETRPMATTVADCHIHDGGHIYPSAIGIWIGNAGMNRIQHNTIHHFTYTGISFGWVWGYAAFSRGYDNRIENNHVHHINHERILSDNGGIYSLGLQSGSKVTGNHIHDIACYHYGGWGIYPDEGSSGILYENNCVHDIQFCGMRIHYGRFLTFQNNIFARMDQAMLGFGREELSCGNRFEQNIVWFDRDNLGEGVDRSVSTQATARNVVWNAALPDGVHWPLGSLANEQAAGRWIDSLEADPLFSDPTGGDFSLRKDCPALALGFKPLDWRQAGPRYRSSRPASYLEYSLPEAEPIAVAVAEVEVSEFVEAKEARRIEAIVRVRNVSALSVSGIYDVVGVGPDSQRWAGDPVIVALHPGEAIECKTSLAVPLDVRRFWLMACGDERRLFSGAAMVNIAETINVPLIAAWTIPTAEKSWQESLPEGTLVERSHAGTRMLTARIAVAGGYLCMVGEITDPSPVLNDHQPWNGSSLEFFLAPEHRGSRHQISQYVLLPPVRGSESAFRGIGGTRAPDGAAFSADLVEGGWCFALRLPLSQLGIEPSIASFRLDLIVNATTSSAEESHLRVPVWGSLSNQADSAFLARVECGP